MRVYELPKRNDRFAEGFPGKLSRHFHVRIFFTFPDAFRDTFPNDFYSVNCVNCDLLALVHVGLNTPGLTSRT